MAEFKIQNTTTTDLTGRVEDYSVDPQTTDAEGNQKETVWNYPNSAKYLGYYKTIPELKKAIDALAMWVGGKGYTTNSRMTIILQGMSGWGEDSFEAILSNMIIQKKIYGDAFAEIIRDKENRLLNIKPLNPANMTVVVDEKGIIKRYEQRNKKDTKKFKPNEILHLVNDRVADEIHGVSVIDAVQWVIDARNEALEDLRQILHRSKALGILEIDTDEPTKRDEIKTQYENMIKNGEVLVYPKGVAELKDANLSNIQIQEKISWIKYLENFFYQALGIPKVILGGSEEFTEASSKIGYLTFEQVYSKEQRELEADLWNQLAIKITFNKPASLKNELLNSEQKNTGQVGFQPNEIEPTVGRNE